MGEFKHRAWLGVWPDHSSDRAVQVHGPDNSLDV